MIKTDYKGAVVNIGQAWQDFTNQMLKKGYKFSNQGREVYKDWISYESEENVTELQMGIVARKII